VELNQRQQIDPKVSEKLIKLKKSLIKLIGRYRTSIFSKAVKNQLDELIIEKDEYSEIVYDLQLWMNVLPTSPKMSEMIKKLASIA